MPRTRPICEFCSRVYRVSFSFARSLPSVPLPASLTEPAAWYIGGPTSLDRYRLFALAQPTDASAAWLAQRVPAGMVGGGTGQGSGPDGAPFLEVSYLDRPVPAGVFGAQLVLAVVAAGSGGSLLRADAQVTWHPPRTAAEYIDPARYHVQSITVTVGGARMHTVHAVVTSQAFITRLARSLDRAQAEPDVGLGCPAEFADYQLAFSVSGTAVPPSWSGQPRPGAEDRRSPPTGGCSRPWPTTAQ
jgi:hypothetical protein